MPGRKLAAMVRSACARACSTARGISIPCASMAAAAMAATPPVSPLRSGGACHGQVLVWPSGPTSMLTWWPGRAGEPSTSAHCAPPASKAWAGEGAPLVSMLPSACHCARRTCSTTTRSVCGSTSSSVAASRSSASSWSAASCGSGVRWPRCSTSGTWL
ncbi:Uncharacterised protein [Bordetella pertussis]|nr:Uncharacterised protein [Bordetella pertussis]